MLSFDSKLECILVKMEVKNENKIRFIENIQLNRTFYFVLNTFFFFLNFNHTNKVLFGSFKLKWQFALRKKEN